MAKCRGLVPVRAAILREKRDTGYFYWVCSSSLLAYYGIRGYGEFKINGKMFTRVSPTAIIDDLYLFGKKFIGVYLFSERNEILRDKRE